ncbi:MAG: hypothetical protein LE168_03400 [Endomicrobium sp.]|nr:hypothetical protein [Endomicrobium sp.]
MKKLILVVMLCCVFGVVSNADERQEEKTPAGQAWLNTAEGKEWKDTPEGKKWLENEEKKGFRPSHHEDLPSHHSEGQNFWRSVDMQKRLISEQGNLFLQEYQKKQNGEKEKGEKENNL